MALGLMEANVQAGNPFYIRLDSSLGFVVCTVSVTPNHLCLYRAKAAIDKCKNGCVPIKLYLQKYIGGPDSIPAGIC